MYDFFIPKMKSFPVKSEFPDLIIRKNFPRKQKRTLLRRDFQKISRKADCRVVNIIPFSEALVMRLDDSFVHGKFSVKAEHLNVTVECRDPDGIQITERGT